MTTIDFYFDFASPPTYVSYERLKWLQTQYKMQLNYKPMLLGGVFKATGNRAPISVPAKGKYLLKYEMPRFTKRYGVEFRLNPHFPVNTLTLMRATYVAIDEDCFDQYCQVVFDAMWKHGENMADPAVAKAVLDKAGLDGEKLLSLAGEQQYKDKLIATTQEAVDRGAFGAPTFYVGDEMFWGQDRLDFIEEILQQAG
ncbi:2-hydroxychromene-2-carboxylate isomerase [Ketobacter sp. MCCC 1A13808]|uniref:2-hydroxychromene-2-carboxylate isomerase n=1 Tax=Ketobacter sp. MCCC 1A13808 TaxID=2602738 RepID=UPI000F1D82A6|nr:2-hydroxychromene-2-carboxylate isomerase [Ketobacter sp. MCCC 1A13808]MVF10948.1 2-hydroxychromene-2-carboxylate isomerase [Ketobacter sp. MCCC 1A13808]RLP56339.1 MAG: 2-hydroxychromene-2-carboxylate isomerase [Ketobacter sp.]